MESLNESERTFTTTILGGGPETLILLLEALKQSKIHEFLKRDGFAVIEKSTSFGSGFMDSFVVKSTKSSGLSLIKLLLKHPEADEQNQKLMELLEKGKIDESISMIVSTIKNIVNFPKIYEFCSPQFRELLETNVFAKLMQDNVNPSLMLEAGYFLKLLGNSFLCHLKVIKNAEIFIPRREVVSLRLLIDGMILVTARIIEDSETKKLLVPGVKNTERFENYRTKRVILTSPGGPRVHHPQNIIPLDKLIDADGFLQESGYARVYNLLTKQSKKKVLILGANPTAFACISLLLKGPEQSDCYEENVNKNGFLLSKRQKVFEREKTIVNELPTQSDVLSNSSKLSAMSSKRSTGITPAEVNTPPKKKCHGHYHPKEEHNPSPKKESIEESKFQQFMKFTKYGSIKGNEYTLDKKYPKPLIFDDENIVLAYKDAPRLYFPNTQEAIKAVKKASAKEIASTGEVNMLDGLTGETRKLYEDIQEKNEKRVQLLQVSSTAELKDIINQAHIIIDCQGFDPELVLIKDVNGQPLTIRRGPNGGYLVDGHGRIVSEKGVIRGIYTLGLGFEKEEGDRGKVLDPYTRFSKYDNYEHLQKSLFKETLIESFVQDLKSAEDNEEHYESLSKDKTADPFKIEEKKDNKFDFGNMESVIIENESQMYTTLRMFEKMNFDKTKQKHGHHQHC